MSGAKVLAALALLAAAAAAPGAAAPRKGAGFDPEREICRSRPVVGSRLKRVRECHTSQEWEDLKMQERLGMMRKQGNGDPGCTEAIGCGVQNGGRDTPW